MPFLVVVHPRFIYRKMSDVLSTAIRKQIYDLFGREIWCLGQHFGGRWRWTPTEGCIPIIGLVHEAGGRQQKRAHVRTSPLDCHEVSHGQIFELLDSTYPLIFKTYQKTRELIPVLGVNDFYQFLISDPRISIVDWWTELQRWPGGVVIEGGTSLGTPGRSRSWSARNVPTAFRCWQRRGGHGDSQFVMRQATVDAAEVVVMDEVRWKRCSNGSRSVATWIEASQVGHPAERRAG